MTTVIKNFGIAEVKVLVGGTLPFINVNPIRSNFDISASAKDVIDQSPAFRPLLIHYAQDKLETFSAMYPASRKQPINNYIKGSAEEINFKNTNADKPFISWTPTSNLPKQTILDDYLKDIP